MQAATENIITLPFGDAHLSIPAESLVKVLMDGLMKRPALQPVAVPRIGEVWPGQDGGIYAGMARGRDGGADYHLILLPRKAEDVNWKEALAWASEQGGELPTRREQSLLFANLKEEFEERAYWSGEAQEKEAGWAWCLYFDRGGQLSNRQLSELRARAVRRLVI